VEHNAPRLHLRGCDAGTLDDANADDARAPRTASERLTRHERMSVSDCETAGYAVGAGVPSHEDAGTGVSTRRCVVNVQARNGSGLPTNALRSVDHDESVQDLIRAVADDGSFSASEIDRLRRVSDELAPACVEVRVSGRGEYQAEMLRRSIGDEEPTSLGFSLMLRCAEFVRIALTPRVWPAVNREFLDALARRA
jgi:hypothetical protein